MAESYLMLAGQIVVGTAVVVGVLCVLIGTAYCAVMAWESFAIWRSGF